LPLKALNADSLELDYFDSSVAVLLGLGGPSGLGSVAV
jgi:hypothetical protein